MDLMNFTSLPSGGCNWRRRKTMTEETAIRIAEGVERVARAAEIIAAFGFIAICVAIILWGLNR
jgi:hypothetical protein